MKTKIATFIQFLKHRKKENKQYEKQAVSTEDRKDHAIVKEGLIEPELFCCAQEAVKYIYQTTLLIPDVDGKKYEIFKDKFLKKNQITPLGNNGDLMRELKLLDVYFNTFLLSKQGVECGCDFSEEEVQKNIENVIKQCMELERRFGINYMSVTV
ncbi:hypothetical protein [Bacillus sp. JJ722]|uniref:hypothetical protein n=1 Tax=Bacillus sp. JJ722 TaxID=3122973 RepID=UPI002FFDE653